MQILKIAVSRKIENATANQKVNNALKNFYLIYLK